MIFYSFHELVG